MPEPVHRTTAKSIWDPSLGRNLHVARCYVCGWVNADFVELGHARVGALRHEWEMNPETKPPPSPPVPPPPKHGRAQVRRMAGDWTLLIRCHCGRYWDAPDLISEHHFAEHLRSESV